MSAYEDNVKADGNRTTTTIMKINMVMTNEYYNDDGNEDGD